MTVGRTTKGDILRSKEKWMSHEGSDNLMTTLENYPRKHRFCSVCKAKVLRAYNILVGEVNRAGEKGFCPALYEGLVLLVCNYIFEIIKSCNYILEIIKLYLYHIYVVILLA